MFTPNELKSFGGEAGRVASGNIYMRLRKEYKDRLEIDFYDPRCFIFLFDTLRYRLRGGEVTWVLNNRVLYRGIPEYDELKALIDAEFANTQA